MDRRNFLKKSIQFAVLVESLSFSLQSKIWAAALKDKKSFFTPKEIAIIAAYFDTIIPKTKTGPSASDTGAMTYLTKLLRSELPKWRRLKFIPKIRSTDLQSLYKQLMIRLNEISQSSTSKPFVNASGIEKIAVVTALSKGATKQVGAQMLGNQDSSQLTDASLFKLTRSHAIQGYFSDPKYGGNKNYLAWDSVGYTCHFNYQKANPACETHEH